MPGVQCSIASLSELRYEKIMFVLQCTPHVHADILCFRIVVVINVGAQRRRRVRREVDFERI